MRFLAWHVDYFKCRITERGRSPLAEEYDDPETVAENALEIRAKGHPLSRVARTVGAKGTSL